MMQTIHAMKEVYNISYPLGFFLAMGGMLFCGKWWRLPWKLDLHNLAQHNRIEHDNSLVHEDADGNIYAPTRVNHTLLLRLLKDTDRDAFTLRDFVHARMRRANEVRKPLDILHKEIAHGETSLTMRVFGVKVDPTSVPSPEKLYDNSVAQHPYVVPRTFIEQWFGEDRLPDGWKKPSREIGFLQAVSMSKMIANEIFRLDWVGRGA